MSIQTYRDLLVWQHSMDLAVRIYDVTRHFPRTEAFGLTSQLRRSAASVPANIAEGYGRDSSGSYIHFLKTARGSVRELETHLILAERVNLVEVQTARDLIGTGESIGKMLSSLIRSIERSRT